MDKRVLDRRDSECKGPETAKDVMCPRSQENAIVVGGSGGSGARSFRKTAQGGSSWVDIGVLTSLHSGYEDGESWR